MTDCVHTKFLDSNFDQKIQILDFVQGFLFCGFFIASLVVHIISWSWVPRFWTFISYCVSVKEKNDFTILISQKNHAKKQFLAFQWMTFHFSSKIPFTSNSRYFSEFKWNHSKIYNFFTQNHEKLGKLCIHGVYGSRSWWNMKSCSCSIHENFDPP